ncbi:MAG: tetratricopeptide repeat protein [Bacteroidota bacterium]
MFRINFSFIIICIFAIVIFFCDSTTAQENGYIADANIQNEKVQAAQQMLNTINDFYSKGKYEELLELSDEAIILCDIADMDAELSQLLYTLGIVYRITDDYANALANFKHSIEYFQRLNNEKGEASSLNQIGAIFRLQGNYIGSLEYLFNSLKKYQSIPDSAGIASALNNIGIVYFYQENYEKALNYYNESLNVEQLMGDEFGISISYINIGEVYKLMGEYQKSLDYYLKALDLALKHESQDVDRDGVGVLYNEIGSIYLHMKEYSLSLDYLKRALRIFTDIDSNQRLSECHLYLGELYFQSENTKQAQNAFQSALHYAQEIDALDLMSKAHKKLNEIYDYLNIPVKAYSHYKKYIGVRDSLFNEDNTRKMAQAELIYEFEKQMQETKLEQAKKDAIVVESNRRQIQLRNFLLAGGSLMSLLVLIVFIAYRQKRKNNIVISEKNALLEQANEEINAQKDEIEASRDMVLFQKAFIEEHKKRMDDSILYAKHIQSALIITDNQAKDLFNDYFIVFRPKEIVSGDFYWATKLGKFVVCVVADCTGHGVPGAFMSMLGISFLNEIIRKKEIIKPAYILEELRKALIEAIIQNSDEDMKREGMYLNIATINTETGECFWSGAKTPLWIVRHSYNNKNVGFLEGKIEEYKSENPPVAVKRKMKDFSHRKIYLNKGDTIYLFSDGIIDQFGGPEGKKFSSKRLKQLISDNADKPMLKQKEIIEKTLDDWQNPVDLEKFEQVDDITLLGIKI